MARCSTEPSRHSDHLLLCIGSDTSDTHTVTVCPLRAQNTAEGFLSFFFASFSTEWAASTCGLSSMIVSQCGEARRHRWVGGGGDSG